MILKNLRHHLRLCLSTLQAAARWDVLIEKSVTLKYLDTMSFGEHCTLQSGAYVYGSREGRAVTFEHDVVVSAGCMLLGEGGLRVGAYTHLGPRVVVTTQYGDSTSSAATANATLKTLPVNIGRGCWIGSNAVVMPGSDLGDECIVAPMSVVYGRWPKGSRLSGNPARPMRGLFGKAAAVSS